MNNEILEELRKIACFTSPDDFHLVLSVPFDQGPLDGYEVLHSAAHEEYNIRWFRRVKVQPQPIDYAIEFVKGRSFTVYAGDHFELSDMVIYDIWVSTTVRDEAVMQIFLSGHKEVEPYRIH